MKSFNIIIFHFYLFATMVVAIPPLLFPCGHGLCTAELEPEELADHVKSERYYPSYISYLRSWIGTHATGRSSPPVSEKRNGSRENSPVGNSPKLPVNSPKSVGNNSPVEEGSPIREIHRREWYRRVVMTTISS